MAVVITLAGCDLIPSASQPTPTLPLPPMLEISPSLGEPGATIVVTGLGWQPADSVLIRLQLPAGEQRPGFDDDRTVATAIPDAKGGFVVSFQYPTTSPWAGLPAVLVTAMSQTTTDQAMAELQVLARTTATPKSILPTASLTPSGPTPTPCIDRATFVDDVTIPDGTYLDPGVSFVKTWRLRNAGTCTWDSAYALVLVDGERLGGPLAKPLPGPVAPGETVDLSLTLTAPLDLGTHRGNWQLRNAVGVLFGTGDQADQSVWVEIIIGPTPTPSPTRTIAAPTPTPTPTPGTWLGEYYANRDLAGTPNRVRSDLDLHFNWGNAAAFDGLPADDFSARWTRTVTLARGTYHFYMHSDDGARVWLDGELILDQWHEASDVTYVAERAVKAGTHSLKIEYFERWGTAQIQFWWEQVGEFPQWCGEYFANPNLAGTPTLVRNDPAVDFNWSASAPADSLPADGFSARWTRTQLFDEGLYRFQLWVDDGLRLFIDDALVLDEWRDGGKRAMTVDYRLRAGYHTVSVEFYERTGEALIRLTWAPLTTDYPNWRGQYWANPTLAGDAVLVRSDPAVDFDWGSNAPDPAVPNDNFSARWTRSASFEAGLYRFHLRMDDGARLWLDDQALIDEWRDGAAREVTADMLVRSGAHTLKVEYFEHTGGALIRFWWEKISPTTFPDWKGEYWANLNLGGTPAFARNDPVIDFTWGAGAPVVGLPVDNFSSRWSRTVTFEPGLYRFYAQADDGVRFLIDGRLTLNEWHDNAGDQVYTVDVTAAGPHALTVEYYERAYNARVKFWWQWISAPPTPTPTATAGP